MDLGLHDSVIVVTGGGAGIGQAISRACLDEGATVVVVSRASDNVKNFLAEMLNSRRKCDFVEAHLADTKQCEHAIDYVRSRYGRMVGLVNNAGANDGVGLESGSPDRFVESLQPESRPLLRHGALRAAHAQGLARLNREHQLQSRAHRPGRNLRLRRRQRRAAGAHSRMGC